MKSYQKNLITERFPRHLHYSNTNENNRNPPLAPSIHSTPYQTSITEWKPKGVHNLNSVSTQLAALNHLMMKVITLFCWHTRSPINYIFSILFKFSVWDQQVEAVQTDILPKMASTIEKNEYPKASSKWTSKTNHVKFVEDLSSCFGFGSIQVIGYYFK